MNTDRCDYCGENIEQTHATCTWKQGRCPHRPAMIAPDLLDIYRLRFYNLCLTIKGWFK
jgi:hypothetical protein